jgi:hypothetical protein
VTATLGLFLAASLPNESSPRRSPADRELCRLSQFPGSCPPSVALGEEDEDEEDEEDEKEAVDDDDVDTPPGNTASKLSETAEDVLMGEEEKRRFPCLAQG